MTARIPDFPLSAETFTPSAPENSDKICYYAVTNSRAKDYGRTLIWSSPLYQSSEIKGPEIVVTFDHAGEQLQSCDDKALKRFEIAGDDKIWHWAEAAIVGKDRVHMRCADVPRPVAVRYA